MFRFASRRLAIGSFSLFMREQKDNPKLKGLGVADRSRMLSSMYKGLSPKDMEQLVTRAKAVPTPERKPRKQKNNDGAPREKRAPSAYAQFVKANIHKFEKLPHLERMKAVAKLWNIEKNSKHSPSPSSIRIFDPSPLFPSVTSLVEGEMVLRTHRSTMKAHPRYPTAVPRTGREAASLLLFCGCVERGGGERLIERRKVNTHTIVIHRERPRNEDTVEEIIEVFTPGVLSLLRYFLRLIALWVSLVFFCMCSVIPGLTFSEILIFCELFSAFFASLIFLSYPLHLLFAMMFKFTLRRFAIGAYSLFMREQKNHPKLRGLAVGQRGKVLATMYKNLTSADKAMLEKRAKAVPTPVRKVKNTDKSNDKKARKPRAPGAYAQFVKANIHKFDKLPHLDRMKAVAKLWNQKKKK
eukprot:gene6725-4820_t